MSVALARIRPVKLQPVAETPWKERLRRYYDDRNCAQYWNHDFEGAWKKFQRGVQQELDLAELVSHWMDFRGRRVLVIGSHFGFETIAYALLGADVVGIDLDEPAVDIAKDLAREYGVEIDFRGVDACDTPFADGEFDYVSCAQVLEHLPRESQPRLLAEMARVCKRGGLFWLDTPNQHAFRDRHDTGLPFIHWLPRAIKVPIAKALGRAVLTDEPAFGFKPVYLHYYMSYLGLCRTLKRFGSFKVLSRYRGYADIEHYAAARRRQGRGKGASFAVKTAILGAISKVWDWNLLAGMRLVIRKT